MNQSFQPEASERCLRGERNEPAELPAHALYAGHDVKVLVPAQDRKPVLQGECCDPGTLQA
jgi:hypothetical protein